jgi:nucleoid DNA-binding protein
LNTVKISDYIKDLLFSNEVVIIPDLGAFKTVYTPATVNEETKSISPPTKKLEFDSSLTKSDGLLVKYIAEHEKITNSEAKEIVFKYVTRSFMKIEQGKSVYLEGIGNLSYDKKKKLIFQPENSINFEIESYGLSSFKVIPVKETAKIPKAQQKKAAKKEIKKPPKKMAKKAPQQKKEKVKKEPQPGAAKKKKVPVGLIILIILIVFVGGAAALYYTTNYLDKPVDSLAESLGIEIPGKLVKEKTAAEGEKQYEIDSPEDKEAESDVTEDGQPKETGEQPAIEEEESQEATTDEDIPATEEIEEQPTETVRETSPPPVTPSGDKKYFLIAGSYKNMTNAERRRNELVNQGYNGAEVIQAGPTIFRVSTASFANKSQAVSEMKRIREEKGRDAVWLFTKK